MPLHRRMPKRGFHNPFRVEYTVVNLDDLAAKFPAGTVVTPELLPPSSWIPFAVGGTVSMSHANSATLANHTPPTERTARPQPSPGIAVI